MRFNSLLLLALLLSVGSGCLAQTADTATADPEPYAKYRIRSSVFGVPTTRDRFLSPLKFSGILVGRNIGTIRHVPRGIRQHNFSSTNGVMLNGVNNTLLTLISAGFDLTYHHRLLTSPDQKLNLYGGGGFNSLLHLKFHSGNTNNVFAHDVALSLDASGLVTYAFTVFRRQFVLTEQLGVPLGAVISRPAFVWAIPYFIWEEEGQFRDAIQASSWGNYWRLQNRLSLDFQTNRRGRRQPAQKNTWRLSYIWDYHQMNRPNQVRTAQQNIAIGRMLKI
jgi:hypothetical protein